MYRTIFIAFLACVAAAPGLFLTHEAHLAVPLTAKSTFTQSRQIIDHGATFVHAPAVPVVHTPIHLPLSKITVSNQVHVIPATHGFGHALVHSPVVPVVHSVALPKTTVTKSNQLVNHGGTAVVHAPVVPVHQNLHFNSAPLVSLRTGDSAVSHQSSTVHETVPIVKSLPLYAVHH